MRQRGLFGLSEHLEALSRDGDPLEVLDATVNFEYFRNWLVEGLGYGDAPKGGRPPGSTDDRRMRAQRADVPGSLQAP